MLLCNYCSMARYAKIEPKKFESTIPPALVDKLSETDKHIICTMNVFESRISWLEDCVLQSNTDLLDCSARLEKVEAWTQNADKLLEEEKRERLAFEAKVKELLAADGERNAKSDTKIEGLLEWKHYMSGKWFVVWAVAMIVLSVIAKWVIDSVTKK